MEPRIHLVAQRPSQASPSSAIRWRGSSGSPRICCPRPCANLLRAAPPSLVRLDDSGHARRRPREKAADSRAICAPCAAHGRPRPTELERHASAGTVHLLAITIPWTRTSRSSAVHALVATASSPPIASPAASTSARASAAAGFTEDDAYSIALVGVPSGIIGARACSCRDKIRFEGHWIDVLKINEGGITIYGAIIGGILGSVATDGLRRMPVTRGLDVRDLRRASRMAIGRIGDFINRRAHREGLDLPWP